MQLKSGHCTGEQHSKVRLFIEWVKEMERKFADQDSKINLITNDCHTSS